jgi:hypothetical protein
MKTKILPFVLVLLAFAGCRAKAKLSNSHRGLYRVDQLATPPIDVKISMLPIPSVTKEKEKPKTAWDLRDSLPHILVKLLGRQVCPNRLFSLMSRPFPTNEASTPDKPQGNFSEFKVRLSLSSIKEYFKDEKLLHPNTRLEFLNTKITLTGKSSAIFYTLDKLENEFEEIDLGSLERSQTTTFDAKLTASNKLGRSSEQTINNSSGSSGNNKYQMEEIPVYDSKGNLVGTMNTSGERGSTTSNSKVSTNKAAAEGNAEGQIGFINNESIKEAIAVKRRQMKTGFSITEKELNISQRGRPNGDISDNVYITATLAFDKVNALTKISVYQVKNLFNAANQPEDADKVVVTKRDVDYVRCATAKADSIILSMTYEGAIRAVRNAWTKSGNGFLENDDKVTYYRFKSPAASTIHISASSYCRDAYSYKTVFNDKTYTLRIQAPLDAEFYVFTDDDPILFHQWLLYQQAVGTPASLKATKYGLYFMADGNSNDTIKVATKDINDADVKKFKALTITTDVR